MKHESYVPITSIMKRKLNVTSLQEMVHEGGYIDRRAEIVVAGIFGQWLDAAPVFPSKGSSGLRPILLASGYHDWEISTRGLLVGDSIAFVYLDWTDAFTAFMESVIGLEQEIDRKLVIPVPDSVFDGSPGIRHFMMKMMAKRLVGSEGKVGVLKDIPVSQITECIVSLDLCSRFPEAFDLVSRDSNSTAIYKFLIKSSMEVASPVMESHDQVSYFPRLLNLPLPTFRLSVPDMIKIRDDGLFDEWQAAFSASLSRLRDPSTILGDADQAAVQDIQRELESRSKKLSNSLGRRPSIRKAITGTAGLSVSCVAGALSAGASPALSTAIGGSSYLAGAVTSYLGSRPIQGIKAFRRLNVQLFDGDASAYTNKFEWWSQRQRRSINGDLDAAETHFTRNPEP